MITELVDIVALLDAMPRIARRPIALVTRTKHAVEIAHEMKQVHFLPACEQFLYLRSHKFVAGHGAGEARGEAQLRTLNLNDVGSAPVVYRAIAASQDDDLIRSARFARGSCLNLKQPNPSLRLSLVGLLRFRGLGGNCLPFLSS